MKSSPALAILATIFLATGASAVFLEFIDAPGDVAANDLGGQVDPDLLDILRIQIGPETPEYWPVHFQVKRLPNDQDSDFEVQYVVTGTSTKTDENIRASATYNGGNWGFGYQITGQGRTVALTTEGEINYDTNTVTTLFPRFQLENPGPGDGMKILTADSKAGLSEVLFSCDFQACDEVTVNGTFNFEVDTGAGVTWVESSTQEGDELTITGTITFNGPDMTIASSNPTEFTAAVIGDPDAKVTPTSFSLQVGEQVNLTISIQNPESETLLRIMAPEGPTTNFLLSSPSNVSTPTIEFPEPVVGNETEEQNETPPVALPFALIALGLVLRRRRE